MVACVVLKAVLISALCYKDRSTFSVTRDGKFSFKYSISSLRILDNISAIVENFLHVQVS